MTHLTVSPTLNISIYPLNPTSYTFPSRFLLPVLRARLVCTFVVQRVFDVADSVKSRSLFFIRALLFSPFIVIKKENCPHFCLYVRTVAV